MLYNYTLAIPFILLATTVHADVPRVVTDIAPVHALVATVMQGVGAPDLLVEPGATPHSFALRPSQARALEQAGAVFWVGEAMTPWMEGPLEELAGPASKVELLDVSGTVTLSFREGAIFEEAHDDDDHGHDHANIDPHAWLDPENGKIWLSAIAEELAQIDPENADTYRLNARTGRDSLDAVSAEITSILGAARDKRFVVFHDAYQYFEARFGLTSVGAISVSDASAPSPARLQELRAALAAQNVSCAFSEPQFNAGLVDAVLEGSDANAAVLDPLGAALDLGPNLYPDLLRAMARSIADC